MVLPDKITAQGWALAPIASATRPQARHGRRPEAGH